MNGAGPDVEAGLVRRALALAYEVLLLAAVLIAAGLPFVLTTRGADPIAARIAFQLYLVGVVALYFCTQWLRGGRTLPMKTWRLRLVTSEGRALSATHALRRFLFALAGAALCGAGFLWALVDPDRRFLHDRLAGTKIVREYSAAEQRDPPP